MEARRLSTPRPKGRFTLFVNSLIMEQTSMPKMGYIKILKSFFFPNFFFSRFQLSKFRSIQDNWTALLCAAKEGHSDICLELFEHGADLEHRDMVRKINGNFTIFPFLFFSLFLYPIKKISI